MSDVSSTHAPFGIIGKVIMIFLILSAVFLWSGVIATMYYLATEPQGSGGAEVDSPLSLSVPVFECSEGEHIVIDGVLGEQCTGHSQDAGQLYIPGGYSENSRVNR